MMINTEKTFSDILSDYRERVDNTLKHHIISINCTDLLRDAMLYSAFNGGKRLRPILAYTTAASFGAVHAELDYIAAALEAIHCHSLIHDDLPAMDDDILRRGKPTCHIAFDEATAILAGDAFQTLAFYLLSQPKTIPAESLIKMITILAKHSGAGGMVGGQSLDLQAEGKMCSLPELDRIHALKTGALIRACVAMGAIAAGCQDNTILKTLDDFAHRLGLAFQLQDDLLDIIGDSEKLGKNTGQDAKHKKATHATILGITETEKRIATLMNEGKQLLQSLPLNTTQLNLLCDKIISRKS